MSLNFVPYRTYSDKAISCPLKKRIVVSKHVLTYRDFYDLLWPPVVYPYTFGLAQTLVIPSKPYQHEKSCKFRDSHRNVDRELRHLVCCSMSTSK